MSMPDISLETINPRIALASVVASIALQEAAVSHVLNAEGEKIQAVVGMTGTTVGDLRAVNLSVGGTMDNIALFQDDLQNKLRTALLALFPAAQLTIYFIDSVSGVPVDCRCVLCTLLSYATGNTSTFYAQGDSLTLRRLTPGSYALHMEEACPGYTPNDTWFYIDVDARGNVAFNGAPVTNESPAIVVLNEA